MTLRTHNVLRRQPHGLLAPPLLLGGDLRYVLLLLLLLPLCELVKGLQIGVGITGGGGLVPLAFLALLLRYHSRRGIIALGIVLCFGLDDSLLRDGLGGPA